MNDEDWKYLQEYATKVFRRNRFVRLTTKDDFVQDCAIAALKNLHSITKFDSAKDFIHITVWFEAKKWYDTTANKRKGGGGLCSASYNEIPGDLLDLENRDEMLDGSEDQTLADIDHVNWLKKAQKILKSGDYRILLLTLEGNKATEVAREVHKSSWNIKLRRDVIITKLESLS